MTEMGVPHPGSVPGFAARSRIALGQIRQVSTARVVPVATWPSSLRRGLLVGIIVAVAAATGHLAWGFPISIGALNLGLVDGAVPRRVLTKVLGLVTVGTGVVCFLSSAAAGTWWSVPLLVVLAYVSGCLSGSGIVAMHVALVSLITGLVFSNDPADARGAAIAAGLAVFGCVLQTVSSLIAWRYEREATVRRSIGTMIEAIASMAGGETDVSEATFNSASKELAAEQTLSGARLDPAKHASYATVVTEANWVRLTLATWLSAGEATDEQRVTVSTAIQAADAGIRFTGHPVTRAQPAPLTESGDPVWDDLLRRIQALNKAVLNRERALSVQPAAGAIHHRADAALSWPARIATWLPLFTPSHALARHGLRLAIAVGIAQILTLALHIDRGYWLAVTAAIVLRPDFAGTVTHGLLRAAGTVAGVLAIGLVLALTGGPPWLLVVLVLLLGPLVMRFQTANYGLETFFITCLVLALLETAATSIQPVGLRLLNTIGGFVIAVAVYLALPAWKGDELAGLLHRLIETHRLWLFEVLAAAGRPAHADAGKLRELGRVARDSSLKTRPAAEGTLIEPHRFGSDPNAAIALLQATQELAAATLVLETTLRDRPHDISLTGSSAFASAIDATLLASEARIMEQDHPAPAMSAGEQVLMPSMPTTGDATCDRALERIVSSAAMVRLASARL